MRYKFSIFNFQFLNKFSNFKFQIENSRSRAGFTLIELLVAVSIIGILVSLLLASFTIVQQQARNTQRKNDLKQYQTALENYAANKNSLYPKRADANGVSATTTLCGYLSGFIASPCPQDPREGASYSYKYQSDGTGADDGRAVATKWVLWALLEGTTNRWVVCSTGASGEKAPATDGSLTLPGEGGCPLP